MLHNKFTFLLLKMSIHVLIKMTVLISDWPGSFFMAIVLFARDTLFKSETDTRITTHKTFPMMFYTKHFRLCLT